MRQSLPSAGRSRPAVRHPLFSGEPSGWCMDVSSGRPLKRGTSRSKGGSSDLNQREEPPVSPGFCDHLLRFLAHSESSRAAQTLDRLGKYYDPVAAQLLNRLTLAAWKFETTSGSSS